MKRNLSVTLDCWIRGGSLGVEEPEARDEYIVVRQRLEKQFSGKDCLLEGLRMAEVGALYGDVNETSWNYTQPAGFSPCAWKQSGISRGY